MINKSLFGKLSSAVFLFAAMAFAAPTIALADDDAKINFIIVDSPGEGFNDPTAAAPIGGNPGITVGEQRLNAFKFAAKIWSGKLESKVPINILAMFDPLSCTATSAVLGSAGAWNIYADFPGAKKRGTWYNSALANKLAKAPQGDPALSAIDNADIIARFNANLGKPGCLEGSGFYLGLDNNHGTLIDLVTVLLHEFGHGLGFQALTFGGTGERIEITPGVFLPAIWESYLLDNTTNKLWVNMTDAERAASARRARGLVWNGKQVTRDAPKVLSFGVPELNFSPDISGGAEILFGTASFGPDITGLSAKVAKVTDQATGAGLACVALDAANAAAVAGKLALIDRGVCGFVVKVKNAQNAGAIGVLIADNVAASPPPGLGGADPTITIPAVRISLADGNLLKAALANPANVAGVTANISVNLARLNGTDKLGRALMYSPLPYAGGSSVSHFDTSAKRNLLMEPFINDELLHKVSKPEDLTLSLFKDIGWDD